jgi:hypothetical protein
MHGLATAMIAAPRPGAPREIAFLRPIPSHYADMDTGAYGHFHCSVSERSRLQTQRQRLLLPDVQQKMWRRSRKVIRRRGQTCEAYCRQFATTR